MPVTAVIDHKFIIVFTGPAGTRPETFGRFEFFFINIIPGAEITVFWHECIIIPCSISARRSTPAVKAVAIHQRRLGNALDVADAIKNRAENEAKGIVEDAKQKAKNIIDNAKQEAKSIIDNAQNIYAENEQLKEENADLQKVCDAYDALALEFMLEDRATTIQLLQECNFSNSYIESVIAKADDIIKQNQKNCAYYDYDER